MNIVLWIFATTAILAILRIVYLLEKIAFMLFYLNDNIIIMHEETKKNIPPKG